MTGARQHRAEEAADRARANDGYLSKRIAHARIVGEAETRVRVPLTSRAPGGSRIAASPKKFLHRRREQLCA
jgi:hypothetical protein